MQNCSCLHEFLVRGFETDSYLIKVVDSCQIVFEISSDTFRSVSVYRKEQESRKKNIYSITAEKNSSS